MKSALVGCGNISRMHFAAVSKIDGVEMSAVVDIKPERADSKAAELGAKAYYDFDEMLKNEEIDCLHICTPHYLHTRMAVKALENGINVLIEKPCSVSAAEVELLREAQVKSGKQVAVCFQNRYNNSSIAAKEIITSGKMGRLNSIRAFLTWNRGEEYYSDDWHGTLDKECGGVIINQAIHTVDLISWFGGECKELSAHTFNDHLQGKIEVEDTATVFMKLDSGITALLYATLAYSENSDVMIELSFDEGRLRIEGERLYSFDKNGAISELCEKNDKAVTGRAYWGHGHEALIRDYYDCLKTGRKFAIDSFEGGKAALTVAACYKR